MEFVTKCVRHNGIDLVILDNFSTLGEVEDENTASSFNSIQQFLLQLKVEGVATMLVHHANKTGEDFRGQTPPPAGRASHRKTNSYPHAASQCGPEDARVPHGSGGRAADERG
jgi:hypothetical protein